jgi:hypothetical protein
MLERRIVRVHFDLGEDGREWHLIGQQVAQLLLDHVADHAFGLRAKHVERVARHVLIGLSLQRQ